MVLLSVGGVIAQTYPLSENSWNNPEFVNRFLGSYGVLTEKEPQITTDESEVFQKLGELLKADDMQGATRLIKDSIKPESSAALDYTLGNLYLQASDFNAGIKAYEGAIRKFPNFQRAYKNVALAYIQMQNYEKGMEYLIKSIELGNQEGDSFGLLGYCYLNLDQNESALDAYRIAGVLSPNNKDWQVGKATALQRNGMHEESLAKFDELIAESPKNKAYYTAAANSSLSLQKELLAAKYLELLNRRGIADIQAKMLLGDIYLNQKLYSLSTKVYGEVLDESSNPDITRLVRYTRGLIAMGAINEADKFLGKIESRKSSLSNDEQRDILNLRSKISFALGDAKSAVASLEQVIKIDPTNGEALLMLGEHYFEESDNEQALFYFERAQKLESSKVDAYVQAARVKVAQRKFEQAVELLQKAEGVKHQAHVEAYLNAVKNALKSTF